MATNVYFGRTQSESLHGLKQLGLSLTRDLESLKETSIKQSHIDKLNLMIAEVESAGTHCSKKAGEVNNTYTKDQVRKQITYTIDLLEGVLILNTISAIAPKRTMYLRQIKNARIGELSQRVKEFLVQLNEQKEYYSAEAEIDLWIERLNRLITDYNQAIDNRSEAKIERQKSTKQRSDAFAGLINYGQALAKIAKTYWLQSNDPRYKSYVRINTGKKTTEPSLPEAMAEVAAGEPVTVS